MTRRPQMPVPEVVAAKMTRIVHTANDLADLAQHVGDAYAELYDAAYRKTSSGGDGLSINRPGAPLGDPTGDVATSGMHERMRHRVEQAARHIRRIEHRVEQAADIIVEAWAEQDPEFQEKLRRLRQLEKEIAGQTELGGTA
jgi:hypothetical protein